jgi:cobalt-zinc-cadmium efflux system membrane fusion protein
MIHGAPTVRFANLLAVLLGLATLVTAVALSTRGVAAHEGHDHDKPPPLTLPIAPRVTAVTPDYELVGVLSGTTRLTLFLTTFATNEPVKDAKITVEAGGRKAEAVAKGDGVFDISAPWLAGEGGLDLVFALTLTDGADLLTGRLERPLAAPDGDGAVGGPGVVRGLISNPLAVMLGIGGVILGVLGTLLFSPRTRTAGVAEAEAASTQEHKAAAARADVSLKAIRRAALTLLLVAGVAATVPSAQAADAAMAPAGRPAASTMATDLAQRLADGSLFVPKATQHLLSVRTALVAETDATSSVELAGTIVAGPDNFGRAQAAHSGRLSAPEGGLAYIGKHVEKGDVLGYLDPHIGTVERGTLASQIAEVDARIETQKTLLARYRKAPLAVPPVKIDEAEGELKALQERRRELNPTLTERHEIRAPITGIVSKAGYFAGQVIEPRDVLFEIVDPSQFWVEAIAYGDTPADATGKASAVAGSGEVMSLHFIGRGLALKEQAAPLMFRVTGAMDGLSIGQPVRVLLSTTRAARGFVVPASSIVRGPSGLPIVWVKTEAERFEPQTVRTQPLDGNSVVVTAGLKPDMRVVTEGVTLLNQVR